MSSLQRTKIATPSQGLLVDDLTPTLFGFTMLQHGPFFLFSPCKGARCFIKQYIRLHKNLTQEQRDEIFISERKRFGI